MKRGGFTLIELLIVIAIIAILAGAMIPMFRAARAEAKRSKTLAELDNIKSAALMLYYDTGWWPRPGTSGNGLWNALGRYVDEDGDTDWDTVPDWRGPYIDDWGEDPWGNPAYQIYDVGWSIRVRSAGPDGSFGTDDDVPSPDEDPFIITPDRRAKGQ